MVCLLPNDRQRPELTSAFRLVVSAVSTGIVTFAPTMAALVIVWGDKGDRGRIAI